MLHRLCPRLCRAVSNNLTQTRTTIIVKRVHKPPLVGNKPLETSQKTLDESVKHTDDDKWMLYEVVEKSQRHHTIKVILLRNVDDYGRRGQVIEADFLKAHNNLLLPGFAVYHTEENCEKHKDILIPEGTAVWSSPAVEQFHNFYCKRVFDVCMNSTNTWTLEPWHIKATLRKHKIWCSEEDIEIPGGQIQGPDMELENKEFIAILKINYKEKIKLRCRLHHIGDNEVVNKAWYLQLAEPVWEHERQELKDMNKAPPSKLLRETKEYHPLIEKYELWRNEREERLA